MRTKCVTNNSCPDIPGQVYQYQVIHEAADTKLL